MLRMRAPARFQRNGLPSVRQAIRRAQSAEALSKALRVRSLYREEGVKKARGRAKPVMPRPMPLGDELRGLTLGSGGRGAFVLYTKDHPGSIMRWISNDAVCALIRAASRLGYGDEQEGWYVVARALHAGALGELISEAVEEVESEPKEPSTP